MATSRRVQERRQATFDVICAGNPLWRMVQTQEGLAPGGVRFGSGIVNTARLLAGTGIRVGLATVLDDDVFGRAWVAELGIDVGGVVLASPATSLVVVDAVGAQSAVLSERETSRDLDVPAGWSSQVLLLSGLSPVTATGAALCKAARRARREGTMVVLDLAAGLRPWAGRDPRVISMVVREADVVRCSFTDLAILGTDASAVRRTMRSNATLVINDTRGAVASGPFGEVECGRREGDRLPARSAGDVCNAAICAEWSRPSTWAESMGARWHRVLRRWASAKASMTDV